MSACPEVGQLVVVRKRPFVVMEIVPSAVNPATAGGVTSHLLNLSSVEDDGLGEELNVIWELEPGTSIHEKSTLPEPTAFDEPSRLQAFLDAVKWRAISQAMIVLCIRRSAAALKSTNTSWIRWSARCPCRGSIS